MGFKDLGDWAELDLALPINSKTYRLPPISAELGPRVQALVEVGVDLAIGRPNALDKDDVVLDDIAERALYEEILHPCVKHVERCGQTPEERCPRDVYQEMQDDGVPWAVLKIAAMTSMFDAVFGRELAEGYWNSGGKRPARATGNRQARRATASKTKPASTGGTTRRPGKQATAPDTGGRKSSPTGA